MFSVPERHVRITFHSRISIFLTWQLIPSVEILYLCTYTMESSVLRVQLPEWWLTLHLKYCVIIIIIMKLIDHSLSKWTHYLLTNSDGNSYIIYTSKPKNSGELLKKKKISVAVRHGVYHINKQLIIIKMYIDVMIGSVSISVHDTW